MKTLPAGTKQQVFGAALVALCLLVILFSVLLGFALDRFYLVLLALGVILCILGSRRRRTGAAPEKPGAELSGMPRQDPAAPRPR